MKLSGLIAVAVGFTPENNHLAGLQTDTLNDVINRENVFSGKVEKHFQRIIKQWDTKLISTLSRKGCLNTVSSQWTLETSGVPRCTLEAIDFIQQDLNKWLDTYVDIDGRQACRNILGRQHAKITKLHGKMQTSASDASLLDCPSGLENTFFP